MTEPKELKISNLNNVLECDAFLVINIAPPSFTESALERKYLINHKGQVIEIKLVDICRLMFREISSTFTLPAAGMEVTEWKTDWMMKYPTTLADTPMCIYYYKKVQ